MVEQHYNRLAALLLALAFLIAGTCAQAEAAYTPPPMDDFTAPLSEFGPEWPMLVTEQFAVIINPGLEVAKDGSCAIWLGNPEGNPCYLMLDIRLKDGGLLIYRTGLVAPGEGIPAVEFVPDALAVMAQGQQEVQLTVRTFELDTFVNLGDITLGAWLRYEP